MSVKVEDYVEAARAIGNPRWRIALFHILPNIMPALLVQATLSIAAAIIAEAALSFLGLGQQPPAPSWGSMLNAAQRFLTNAPWMAIWPGLAIFLVVLSFNLVGDGLRDALSDCLGCPVAAANWFRASRAFALRMTRSLRARAMRMTILAFPAVCNRCWKAAKCGSCWATMRATMKRMLRGPARPPRIERRPLRWPLSSARGARPTSLLTARLEKLPISGTSASRRATERSATPLIWRKARSRQAQRGSSSMSEAISPSRWRRCA